MLHGTSNNAQRLKFNITGLHDVALVLAIGIARHQGQNYINRAKRPGLAPKAL